MMRFLGKPFPEHEPRRPTLIFFLQHMSVNEAWTRAQQREHLIDLCVVISPRLAESNPTSIC